MNTHDSPSSQSDFQRRHVSFIGGGNMGAALASGLLAKGWPADHVRILEPASARRRWLQENLGISASDDSQTVLAHADAVVIAVKPQQMEAALAGISLPPGTLVLSIAAGVRIEDLRRWLGAGPDIVRCMPNTPALVGAGAAALCAEAGTAAGACALAEALISAVGICRWVSQEAQLDAVTALSGSGPAYFFLLAEAMQQAGEGQGLPAEDAAALARQTLIGAGRLVEAEATELAELRARVTSKGGTTAAALESFEASEFRTLVDRAMAAAATRSRELAGAGSAN